MKRNGKIDINMSFEAFARMITGKPRDFLPKLRSSGYGRPVGPNLRRVLKLPESRRVTFGELSLKQITSPEVTPDVLSQEGIRARSLGQYVKLLRHFGIDWSVGK